jgi:hypothetical protein
MGRWIGKLQIFPLSTFSTIVFILFRIRFRERLQNSLPLVHGINLVGFQATLRERTGLSWIQGYAFLDRL